MANFKYVAIDKHGKEIKGIEESDSMNQVVSLIREKGLYPVSILPVIRKSIFSSLSKGSVKRKVLTVSTRQLATLLTAGLPLVRSLKVIRDQQPAGYWKKVLTGIIEVVERGGSFSDALSRYKNVFSKLYINMVKAGESAGLLEVVLNRLADYSEKSQKLRTKVFSALMYPFIVLGMAILILIGLMIFVVPKFAQMFDNMGVELPVMTGILIRSSSKMLTLKFWLIVIAIVIIAKLLFSFLKKIKKGRYVLDNMKLKLPVFGKLIQKLAISRFASTLGTLVGSGVPILQALNIVKETVGNEVISEGLSTVHDGIKEGESIVAPLRSLTIFDPMVINMIAVGEETGKLDEMLLKSADTYESEVDIMVSGFTALLEPFMIIGLALIIGFIVIALFLPLVSLLTSLAA